MILLVAVVMIGCGMNRDKVAKDNATNNQVKNEITTKQPVEKNTGNTSNDNQTHLEVAKEASDRVAELEEVNSATVIVTNHNAYVAAVLQNPTNEEITTELEDKIAEEVKSTNTAIQNVYVSLNPDFVASMTGYREKINEGKPVAGFFEEFSEAMRRVFPNAH